MSILSKIQTPVFNIFLCEVKDENIFELSMVTPIKRILSTRNPFSFNPIVIEADPFVFVYKETLFLFFEEQIGLFGKGVLKMISTKNLKTWTKPKLILKENFHLSYPNVFEYKDKVYMIPETGHNKDIRLYKAIDDELSNWKFQRILLTGKNYVDSSIFCVDEMYYLMTSEYNSEKQYILRLFQSNNPINGEWKECICSPLSYDNFNARCGGPIINYCGFRYRMAQRCDGSYGGGLTAYSIDKISDNQYVEKIKKTILPCSKFNLHCGGHHYSIVKFKGKNIVAIDYLSRNYNIWEIVRRVCFKIQSK